MKYANRLTDEELREVYGLFIDSDGKINELNIVRDEKEVLEMDNIFVIDTATRCNLGNISFIPHKDDRISMKASGKEIEVVVNCVLYAPWEHATLIFVNIVEPYYTAMINEIKWS